MVFAGRQICSKRGHKGSKTEGEPAYDAERDKGIEYGYGREPMHIPVLRQHLPKTDCRYRGQYQADERQHHVPASSSRENRQRPIRSGWSLTAYLTAPEGSLSPGMNQSSESNAASSTAKPINPSLQPKKAIEKTTNIAAQATSAATLQLRSSLSCFGEKYAIDHRLRRKRTSPLEGAGARFWSEVSEDACSHWISASLVFDQSYVRYRTNM
ncbi:MAG: hypothetical protein R3D82_15415 [Xanthobacteraceae bacterium]